MADLTHPFDEQTWQELPGFLEEIPEKVHLHVWGDPEQSEKDKAAAVLCRSLAKRFDKIEFRQFPRRVNYPYYPVIGVLGETTEGAIDFGVRLIGLPTGVQMTSFITAIQAVSFRGMTLEPITRIKLHQLKKEAHVEILTSAENEGGPLVAQPAFNLAVASSMVRTYLIMADSFPMAAQRYSANILPHIIVNGRIHVEGVISEADLLKQLAVAVS